MSKARSGGVWALIAAVGLTGCGGGAPDEVAVVPVTGAVKFKGQPTPGATVIFHPVGATPKVKVAGEEVRPTASVNPDGSYALTTREAKDGAPAGEYAVTVQWNKLIKSGDEMAPGQNVIPAIYAKSETTKLKVRVNDSATQLDLTIN